ncbi:MAG: hypothetical protein M1826_005354 [Phylliscum demangeonii]|nr:MAG: hypothetical protein M1826_005354 [Phylliscum demangeonii]
MSNLAFSYQAAGRHAEAVALMKHVPSAVAEEGRLEEEANFIKDDDDGLRTSLIANQSPPLTALDRNAAAELFQLAEDSSMRTEDELGLTELHAKQSLAMSLSMSSPGMSMDTTAQEERAMSRMISFDSMDPACLSPEDIR